MPIRSKAAGAQVRSASAQELRTRLSRELEGVAMARRSAGWWRAVNAIGFMLMVRSRRGLHQTRPQAAARRARTDCCDCVRAATALPSGFRRAWNQPGADRVVALGHRRYWFAIVGLCAIAYTMFLPEVEEHQAAVMESAPQRILKTPVLDDTYPDQHQGACISSARWAGRHRLTWRCARGGR